MHYMSAVCLEKEQFFLFSGALLVRTATVLGRYPIYEEHTWVV